MSCTVDRDKVSLDKVSLDKVSLDKVSLDKVSLDTFSFHSIHGRVGIHADVCNLSTLSIDSLVTRTLSLYLSSSFGKL